MSNPKKITVNFKSASQLAEYFLPFFKHGGFFFATNYDFKLHDAILLKLILPDGDVTPIEVEGSVAFINPKSDEIPVNVINKQGAGVAINLPHSFLLTRINALLRMHQAATTGAHSQ